MSEQSISCGPFELVEVIGHGGMGQVWQAVHRAEGTPVAIKVITGDKAGRAAYRDGFRREVQAAARLNHPGVVRVFDYGELDEMAAQATRGQLSAGSPWLAMELGAHGTLADVDLVTWQGVREALLGVLDALAHAHARGVTHRDIKPSNVLLASDPAEEMTVKLADFGIAHAFDPIETRRSGEIRAASAGTPTYMPPEQIHGEWRQFGPWTDLYAFGCMAYELICGRPPFRGRNLVKLALRHVQAPPPALEPRMDVPDGIDQWVQRLLRKQPRRRFQRAADAAWTLLSLERRPLPRMSPTPSVSKDAVDEATTISDTVSATRPLETKPLAPTELLTLGTTALVHEQTVEQLDAPKPQVALELDTLGESPLPPFPPSWRSLAANQTGAQLAGVGLGLYGLRQPPLVGRTAERDVLWSTLGRVRDGSSEALILRGQSGLGKSVLAQWVSRRAHEVGSATVVRVRHSPNGGPSSGLPGLARGFFRCGGLDAHETFAHVQKVLGEVRSDQDWLAERAAAVTALLHPGDHRGLPQVSFSSPRECYVVLLEVIREVSPGRPVLFWLDDLQWGHDSLGLASYVLEADVDGVFVVGTVDEAALAERPVERRLLARLVEADNAREVTLEPLDDAEQHRLVRETLALDDEVVAMVVERTGGDPLFASQLIKHGIERGLVDADETGFSIADFDLAALPGELDELWQLRAEYFLETFDGADEPRRALQMAAALGRSVDLDEWLEACARANAAVDSALVDRLVDTGFAVRDDHGWSFAHDALRELFARWAREDEVWSDFHDRCAEMLLDQVDDPTARDRRRVEHLVEAGRLHDALAPLLRVVEWSFRFASMEQASIYLDRHGELLDQLGLPQQARERLQNNYRRAGILRQRGEADEAIALLTETADVAIEKGWPVEAGAALRNRGVTLANQGQMDAAERDYRAALTHLDGADAARDLALTRFCYAMLMIHRGESEAPRPLLEQAASGFEAIGDSSLQLASLRSVARTFWYDGDLERAREIIDEVIETAREVGDRHVQGECWHELGEWARHDDQLERAEQAYRNAEELYRATDEEIGEFNVRMGRGLVDVFRGEFARAEGLLQESRRVFVARDQSWLLPVADLGLACCAAGQGDWEAFERRWGRARSAVEAGGQQDRTYARMGGIIATLCEEADRDGLAAQARQLVADYGERG